jgi:hypothetical protein
VAGQIIFEIVSEGGKLARRRLDAAPSGRTLEALKLQRPTTQPPTFAGVAAGEVPLAAISAGTTPVADPRGDPGQ